MRIREEVVRALLRLFRAIEIPGAEASAELTPFLAKAGVEFVATPEEAEIDLSLDSLEKDIILKLMY